MHAHNAQCDMTNELYVHVALHDKLRTPIRDMTSLLKYDAMCAMRNATKVHMALHDKVQTPIKYVVIDRHDILIKCHYHTQLTW